MSTLQDILNTVRIDLQDASAVRYPDSELLPFANEAIQAAFRKRPDFRLGHYSDAPVVYGLTDTVPLPVQYQASLAVYVAGRAEVRDDEYSQDGRALQLMGMFLSGLTK